MKEIEKKTRMKNNGWRWGGLQSNRLLSDHQMKQYKFKVMQKLTNHSKSVHAEAKADDDDCKDTDEDE